MTDFSSISIPKPLNWQDFERNCRVLFECILDDPNTQLNGRSGQPQNGVDIWGRRGGQGTLWVGVQCKGKDGDYGREVTEKELRAEVKKASNFMPTLSEFIIATTAPDDAKIQEVARTITQENESSDKPMAVNVWGWGTLQGRIGQHANAIEAFHPDITPFTKKTQAGIDEIRTEMSDQGHKLAQLTEIVSRGFAIRNASDTSTEVTETIDRYLHSDIDVYRDLIKNGRPKTAIDLLEKLKERCWDNASFRVKFRIITNIGAAKLKLGDEKGAAADFLTAADYDPTDRIGMANIALAYMIMGRNVEAIAAAEAALQQDPTNENAASYFIQLHSSDSSVTDPLNLVPYELRDTPAVRMAVIYFFRRRQHPGWRRAALDAMPLFPHVDELKRAAAEANLDAILESRWFLLGERSSVENGIDKLKEAADILESIWNNVKSSEIPLIETSLPHNLAVAYRALGSYGSAARALDEAMERKPDAVDLVGLRAAIHLVLNEEDKALILLQDRGGVDPDCSVVKAELLLRCNPVAAREALKDMDAPGVDEEHRLSAFVLVIESYLPENNRDFALEHANALVNAYPQRIEPLIALFRVQDYFGDGSADETLTRARQLLGGVASFHDRFIVAQALNKRGRFDEVVDVLDGKVDYLRDTPALRLLLPAMINSDRRKQAREVVKTLPREVADQPFYLRMQTAVHMIRGDYPAAEEAIEHYLQIRPKDLSMRLKWIYLRMRRGGETDVRTFLEGNVEQLEGDPSERMDLAMLLDHFGFSQRSLRLGYEIFLKNRRNPQIHLKYMGLLLRPNPPDDINLQLTEIVPDAVFTIENKRGERDTYFVEADEQLRIDEKYIAPDHPIARKTRGLRVNETFVIHDAKKPIEEWHITSIKHKYLDALHKSMEHFERQFPTVGGLERVVIDKEGPESLQPMLVRVKERHDAIEAAFNQYEHNPLPLELLTHSFGGDVIQVWQTIMDTGRMFRVCIGTSTEREAALRAIAENARKGCVVDTLTFYVMRRLGIEDAVSAVYGAIGITEASVDVFRLRSEEIRSHIGNTFMTIFWRDGQYFRHEFTDEELRRALKVTEDDLSWIKEHCEVLPAEGTRDLPSYLREFSKKVGGSFFDPILAADGAGRLLLCDDFTYRTIGVQSGLRTSWLQPVLMAARHENLITMAKFCEAVINMIECRAQFISIDAQVLLMVARDKSDEDGRKFAKVAETLGGPDADMGSNIRVAANFFSEIWREWNPALRHKAQTGKILECLMRGRGEEFRDIVKALLLNVFSPTDGFSDYLVRWLKGHFFLPPK
jgi:tetratricopeptide (TPR) repeat protein